jgi:hypothetical protein
MAVIPADAGFADQWGSRVMAECYADLIGSYQQHMFVRVFHAELGNGQLDAPNGRSEGIFSIEQLSRSAFSCVVNGKTVLFAVEDYRPTRETGARAQCQQTGFRLSVDGKAIWRAPEPPEIGLPIFNGTIDLDKDRARICTEQPENASGDFFESRQMTLVCQTVAY